MVFRNQPYVMHENAQIWGIYIYLHFTSSKYIETLLRELNTAYFQMLILRNTDKKLG